MSYELATLRLTNKLRSHTPTSQYVQNVACGFNRSHPDRAICFGTGHHRRIGNSAHCTGANRRAGTSIRFDLPSHRALRPRGDTRSHTGTEEARLFSTTFRSPPQGHTGRDAAGHADAETASEETALR